MPAIQIARLRLQIAKLSEGLTNPPVFLQNLHDLLYFYADRTFRPGQISNRVSLTPAYQAPAPVLREIEETISAYLAANRQPGLALLDTLWADNYLEPRLLAVRALGKLPPDPLDMVIDRIRAWAQPGEEKQILEAILNDGTVRLRQMAPQVLLDMIGEWLQNSQIAFQSIGLQALLSLLRDPQFENLPAVFRLFSPLLETSQSNLQPILLEIIHASRDRSPAETLHLLRQVLITSRSPNTRRLARRAMTYFTPAEQSSLREILYSVTPEQSQ
jgi:hypothetical protein